MEYAILVAIEVFQSVPVVDTGGQTGILVCVGCSADGAALRIEGVDFGPGTVAGFSPIEEEGYGVQFGGSFPSDAH